MLPISEENNWSALVAYEFYNSSVIVTISAWLLKRAVSAQTFRCCCNSHPTAISSVFVYFLSDVIHSSVVHGDLLLIPFEDLREGRFVLHRLTGVLVCLGAVTGGAALVERASADVHFNFFFGGGDASVTGVSGDRRFCLPADGSPPASVASTTGVPPGSRPRFGGGLPCSCPFPPPPLCKKF